MKNEKISAIVLAAGKGSRMESSTHKQFMDIGGYPLVYYSLKCFENSEVDDLILVTGQDEIEYCRKEIIEKYNISKIKAVVAGGRERYNSVYNGLMAAKNSEYVIIHDGARPFITEKMIVDSIATVKETKACTVGMPVKDTIKILDENQYGEYTPPRKYVWQVQTPQTFHYETIVKAYNDMFCKNDEEITDDTMVVEKYGNIKTKFILGDYRNIKITTPEDKKIAEIFLKMC